MIKKMYLLTLLATAHVMAMAPLGYEGQTADIAALTVQLNHINTQMTAIKRAWNTERINIKMAEKASSALYNAIKPSIEKLIMNTDFITNMDATVAMQYDEIINKNGSFKNIKVDNNLSDLFPNVKMSEYGTKLYKAMANKAYLLRLGQKLADKVKEISAQIKSNQQTPAGPTDQEFGQSQEYIGQSVM
jgi:hypothetical protein